jgi:hypothetical protein
LEPRRGLPRLRGLPQHRRARARPIRPAPRPPGLSEKRQTRYRQALTGTQQAYLIAISCSPVPDGHYRWTLRMLGRKAVGLGFVEKISPETIRAHSRR